MALTGRWAMVDISVAEELQKADELRQRGVISQQEFDTYKAKLLGSSEMGVSGSASPPPPPPPIAPPVVGGFERGGLGGAFSRVTEAASGALTDPGGYYQEHQKGIDEAAGAGLIAEGLGVVPGRRWRVHGLWTVGVFFGGLLILIGWGLMQIGKVPTSYTGVTTASVTALNSTSSTDANGATTLSCQPAAMFTVAHKAYLVTSTETQSPCHTSIGSTVTVVYQPSNPANAEMKPSHVPSIIPWALMVIGGLAILGLIIRLIIRLGMVGSGAALLYKGIKKDPKKPSISTT